MNAPETLIAPEIASIEGIALGRRFSEVLLSVENITLNFGGVRALNGISFDIRKGEIRAIIGPNGAGKTSMLNVINGFYHPQSGLITFKNQKRRRMRPHQAAAQGIARTFQNVALFKGMSTLDNLMAGRMLKMKRGLLSHALYWGPAQREEIQHRRVVEEIIDFLHIEHIRKAPVGGASTAGRADGGHECRREGGHVPIHHRRERAVRDNNRTDRARYGGGDGPL
jgi:branched-chain amino acid transport system ATP-binding protein